MLRIKRDEMIYSKFENEIKIQKFFSFKLRLYQSIIIYISNVDKRVRVRE